MLTIFSVELSVVEGLLLEILDEPTALNCDGSEFLSHP